MNDIAVRVENLSKRYRLVTSSVGCTDIGWICILL
jgi:hypothetical protein